MQKRPRLFASETGSFQIRAMQPPDHPKRVWPGSQVLFAGIVPVGWDAASPIALLCGFLFMAALDLIIRAAIRQVPRSSFFLPWNLHSIIP
jgi:hypothetical protein